MGLNLIPRDLSGFSVLVSVGVCQVAWFRHVSQDSHDLFIYQGEVGLAMESRLCLQIDDEGAWCFS